MSDLKFDIDVEAISKEFNDLKDDVERDVIESVENLANMTHAKTLELAGEKLSSLAQTYMDNVEFSNPMPNFWVVTLKEPAMWIEEGRKSGFMRELLDTVKPGAKPAKVSKSGDKYRIIPFKHNVNPSRQSPKARELADQIKNAMKKKGINWKKIEKTSEGSPRTGLLHRFNVDTARAKDIHKSPLTHGVAVYQTRDKSGNVSRDVMTFRVISEKHEQEGLWNHPGKAGEKIMDEAFDWAMETWEREILPATLEKYK